MSRMTFKDYGSAMRYPYGTRYPGGLSSPQGGDHDYANNIPLTWSDAADVNSIHGISVDTDSRIRVDRSALLGAREIVNLNVPAAGALTTQTIFTADRAMVLTGITELHSTAETATGTATLAVFKDTGTLAPGTGSTTMVGTFNLKATANTLQTATLLSPDGTGEPAAGITLAAGDRLSIVVGGTATITALAGVVVSVYATPGNKETVAQYRQLELATPATAAFFLANRDYQIVGAQLIMSHAATGAPTITLDITQESSTTAPGSGTSILAAAQNVANTATINSVTSLALSATAANLIVRAGNRLSIKSSGSWTGITGLNVVVWMQAIGGTGYIGQNDVTWISIATVATEGFFIADRDYEIVDFSGVWSTASGGGGTLDLTIDKGVVAPGGGTSALASTIALSGTANTVVVGSLSTSRRNKLLNQGDLLSVKIASPASTAGVVATVSLLPR